MAARNFLPRCIAFELRIFNGSIGIRLKNAMHLGKKFLAAIFSVIVYCSLIWLFCSKVANNEINGTHKRARRTVYRDYESTFEELLDRGDTKTTHKKNLQNVMVEIYKSMNHLNPELKMFPTTYGLRNYASSPRRVLSATE